MGALSYVHATSHDVGVIVRQFPKKLFAQPQLRNGFLLEQMKKALPSHGVASS